MKKLLLVIILFINITAIAQYNIIPAPANIEMQNGSFVISPTTVIIINNEAEKSTVNFLNNYLKTYYGFSLSTVSKATKNYISIITPTFVRKPDNEEKYILNVSPNSILIQGDGKAGTFYGIQTLIQLLPIQTTSKSTIKKLTIPSVSIQDQPRFSYRGMHLDVSRHFFPVSYKKKYIDYIALHKMNYFHWHLTDDQGWRIEIKKYPKLTSIGAWRDGTIIGRFPGKGNDGIKHGGYYTQLQVKEIVQYAADRHITVLPEIEMPGHSMAVLAAYPELGTTPNIATKVPMTWGLNGVENNVFAPTEKTFSFLEDVLTEVMDLFPSKMIHIGGDECSKIWWKKDAYSQQLIKEKGLKNEDELQSYFIQRIEKFVNSKGKIIIGWDEILEGGLAPNAAVMSWTGEQGGIHAAKERHNVVMTPGGWCYFDHSQTKNEDSVTIGSYLPLEKVYNYEPIPASLTAEEGKYILGAQGNVWTEYMAYPSKVEYMIFPRMSALSEVLWSNKDKRNWQNFEKRLPTQIKRYQLWKANYSKAYYEIQSSIMPTENNEGLLLKLESKQTENPILIKKENSTSLKYNTPLLINSTTKVEAVQSMNNAIVSSVAFNFSFNKATGKKIISNIAPSATYPGNGGLFSLVNGVKSNKGINSSEWCGWNGKDVELVIDLGKTTPIREVNLDILEKNGSWIYAAESYTLELSNDGINYEVPNQFRDDELTEDYYSSTKFIKIKLTEHPSKMFDTRFIKIKITPLKKIPEGKPGGGKAAWMFIDEIEVN